jgi:hypothetical protein
MGTCIANNLFKYKLVGNMALIQVGDSRPVKNSIVH